MEVSHQINTFYEWNGDWHWKVHIYGVYFLTSILPLTFTFFFMYKKLHFVRKHKWKNLVYIVTFFYSFFFVWHINGKAVKKDQHPHRYAFWRHHTLIANIRHWTGYYNIDFDSNEIFKWNVICTLIEWCNGIAVE